MLWLIEFSHATRNERETTHQGEDPRAKYNSGRTTIKQNWLVSHIWSDLDQDSFNSNEPLTRYPHLFYKHVNKVDGDWAAFHFSHFRFARFEVVVQIGSQSDNRHRHAELDGIGYMRMLAKNRNLLRQME